MVDGVRREPREASMRDLMTRWDLLDNARRREGGAGVMGGTCNTRAYTSLDISLYRT
jgi:hypothetical protein